MNLNLYSLKLSLFTVFPVSGATVLYALDLYVTYTSLVKIAVFYIIYFEHFLNIVKNVNQTKTLES